MKAIFKKITLLVLAAAVVTTATGCNENDVVKGVIVGGIIGGIIGGGNVVVTTPTYGYTYLSECEGYNREWVCEWSYGNRSWYRSQRRWYPQMTESLAIAPSDLKAQEIAKRWALNEDTSLKLSQAIESAKGGDLKAFDRIGLDLATLNNLLSNNKIDANDLANFANRLNTSEKIALDILNAFTSEYASQKKDVGSALWGQCQSTGKWKTPEAASCSSLDAAGCSPANGASNCLSL